MKLKSIHVTNFRHIEKETIEFGDKITAICGQNGTGKSSILGWIAQSCDSKLKEKTLSNSYFKSKYSEIFRFCPDNDFNKIYNVQINFDGEEKKLSTRYIESNQRYRIDFDGRGVAIDFPVIYLGLRRLIPLATEQKIDIKELDLKSKEKNLFSTLSKEILLLTRGVINAESVKSTNKELLAMKTENYGHLGNSAGQDNLGQIISAILSFSLLKDKLKEEYKGGILLIDELDATLYAGSQIKLIDNLFKYARDLNLQIIFTTHSIEILERLSPKLGVDTKINFLKWNDKHVKNEINPDLQKLINNIKVQVGDVVKKNKVQIICEDDVTTIWCKNLINGTSYKNDVEISKGPFPEVL